MNDKNGKLRTVVAPQDGENWKTGNLIFAANKRKGISRELTLSVKNLRSTVVEDYIEKRRAASVTLRPSTIVELFDKATLLDLAQQAVVDE
jgi:hypothetical protein